MRPWSLRLKIIIVVVGVVTAGIVAASFIQYQVAFRELREEVRSRAVYIASEIAFSISTPQELASRDLLSAQIRNILAARPTLRWIEVYVSSPSGLRRVASSRGETPAEPADLALRTFREGRPLSSSGTERGGEVWLAAAPVQIGNSKLGVVSLALSLEGAQRLATSLRQQLLIVLLVAGMTTVITLALFMERSINQPIRALLGTMAAVEQGDLAPLTPFTRRDEMGRLARGLATMLGRIRESQEEEARLLDQISRFNQELRARVAEATEELGRRNEALQRANELLFDLHRRLARAERLAAMGELTATIAHEIGTPLNAVAVHLQLLARSGGLTAEDRQRLITIEEQIQRLVTTVQGFLAATRGDARGQELVDLNQLVRGVTDLMAPALEAKGITVHFALMETLPKILADAHQIQQLILNLITNAVDAMSTGGSLRTETAVGDGSVILRVMDSGPGVPVDVRRRIFEPFFTTKALGEGTGLGLAVCRRIAEGHHGSIQALETPGGGATFEVRLPTAPVEESR